MIPTQNIREIFVTKAGADFTSLHKVDFVQPQTVTAVRGSKGEFRIMFLDRTQADVERYIEQLKPDTVRQ